MIDHASPILVHDEETSTYWWVNPQSPIFESRGAALMWAQLNLVPKENNYEADDC